MFYEIFWDFNKHNISIVNFGIPQSVLQWTKDSASFFRVLYETAFEVLQCSSDMVRCLYRFIDMLVSG